MIEYADHLHSHFVDPVVIKDGCYQVPLVSDYLLCQHCNAARLHASIVNRDSVERAYVIITYAL